MSTTEVYRWFDEIDDCPYPWRDWLKRIVPYSARRIGPLDAGIERKVEDLIQAADARRLDVIFGHGPMWAMFRAHHEALEERGKYRRRRYMIWRAAALKTICDCHQFQDDIDAAQAHNKLAATMAEFGGSCAPDGAFGDGCNFWRPELHLDGDDGTSGFDPLHEYAMVVLALVRATMRDDLLARRQKETAIERDAGAGEGITRH